MLVRYPDWAARLEVFLHAHASRPFRYGEWDCCLFVCSAIEAMTGIDPGGEWRGKYDSPEGARSMIRAELLVSGEVNHWVRAVAAAQRMGKVAPAQAQRGDVVLLKRGRRGYSLGLVGLDGGVLVAGWKGLVAAPRELAVLAWRVGM
jgi:hypothetical protein